MGYRNYIAYIPKKEHDAIKNLTKEKLYRRYKVKADDYMGPYDVAKNELYGFGKYVEFGDEKFYRPVCKNRKLQKEFTEGHDFYVVGPEFLRHVIAHYADKVRKFYSDMLDPFFNNDKRNSPKDFLNSMQRSYSSGMKKTYKFDFSKITDEEQTAFFKIMEHVRSNASDWGIHSFLDMLPYDLENGESVVSSWKYEYSVFELVRIYKSFDWKNNVMIYYGY